AGCRHYRRETAVRASVPPCLRLSGGDLLLSICYRARITGGMTARTGGRAHSGIVSCRTISFLSFPQKRKLMNTDTALVCADRVRGSGFRLRRPRNDKPSSVSYT